MLAEGKRTCESWNFGRRSRRSRQTDDIAIRTLEILEDVKLGPMFRGFEATEQLTDPLNVAAGRGIQRHQYLVGLGLGRIGPHSRNAVPVLRLPAC